MFLANALRLKNRVTTLPFSLSDISGLKAWYKFKTGITVDGSDIVQSWSDSSGNTSEDMDLLKVSGTSVDYVSSSGALLFRTADESELQTASDQLNLAGFTFFAVIDLVEAGAANEAILGRAGNDEFRLYRGGNTLNARLRADGVNYDLTNTNSTPTGKFLLTVVRENDNTTTMFYDGVEQDNVDADIADLFDFTRLGNGDTDADYYEVAIYNVPLNASDRQSVENDINFRNGL